jgi:hypothetical protein
MIRIGNPEFTNGEVRSHAQSVVWLPYSSLDIYEYALRFLKENKSPETLDVGKSSRQKHKEFLRHSKTYHTIDINDFGDYPSIVADLCDPQLKKKLKNRYDLIICSSILEHVYQPFQASENLLALLKPNGLIIGNVPFMFPRHCPEDLQYQDFWRFTPEAIGYLFREASYKYCVPTRGRVASAAIVLTTSYKYVFEKNFPKVSRGLSNLRSRGRHSYQTSSIDFLISKRPLIDLNS